MRTAAETRIPQKYHHTEYIKRITPLYPPPLLIQTATNYIKVYLSPLLVQNVQRVADYFTYMLQKLTKKQKANKRNVTSYII
jgi:hypothetical protein